MTRVTYLRMGSFSGAALSLREALSQRLQLVDVDVIPYAQHLGLLPFRLGACVGGNARLHRVHWTRTTSGAI